MPLSCSLVRDLTFDFLDGELGGEENTAIREHLAICDRCLAEVENQRNFLRAVARAGGADPPAPEELGERVRSILRRRDD
ncbi:MAG TPA: zf-HC2 domain-containing protein [Gemmatimonadaceae bacterium]|nr:zf-HC2 domain-containing protein [Gemmatimonadaceae bacterium]